MDEDEDEDEDASYKSLLPEQTKLMDLGARATAPTAST